MRRPHHSGIPPLSFKDKAIGGGTTISGIVIVALTFIFGILGVEDYTPERVIESSEYLIGASVIIFGLVKKWFRYR